MEVLCRQVMFAYPYQGTAYTDRHVTVCTSLSTQVCDFLKLRLKIWLVLEGDFVKKNGETLTMVLSLQGLYNSFICLLNKYTRMDCKGLTNVTFQESYLLA